MEWKFPCLLAALLLVSSASGYPLFSFSSCSNDANVGVNDDGSRTASLRVPFQFYGRRYRSVRVSFMHATFNTAERVISVRLGIGLRNVLDNAWKCCQFPACACGFPVRLLSFICHAFLSKCSCSSSASYLCKLEQLHLERNCVISVRHSN